MASLTKQEKVKRTRLAGEMFASIADQAKSEKVPQMAEVITRVIDKIGLDKVVQVYVEGFESDNPRIRREIAADFNKMLKLHQEMTGDITSDEISRMTEPALEARLAKFLDSQIRKMVEDERRDERELEAEGSAEIADPENCSFTSSAL